MKHLDPTLLNSQADTLEREAQHEADPYNRAVLLLRANALRTTAREVRREQEVG